MDPKIQSYCTLLDVLTVDRVSKTVDTASETVDKTIEEPRDGWALCMYLDDVIVEGQLGQAQVGSNTREALARVRRPIGPCA
jgi:hypothetical protein